VQQIAAGDPRMIFAAACYWLHSNISGQVFSLTDFIPAGGRLVLYDLLARGPFGWWTK
jgi:hypothetical protein